MSTTTFPPDQFTLPSTDAEEWRYSRIGALDLARFTPASASIRGSGAHLTLRSDRPDVPLGEAIGDSADAFVDLNSAYASDAVVIDVPAGTVVEEPVELSHLVEDG